VGAHLDRGARGGICLDAENAVRYGDVPTRCLRVREGGEVLPAIELDRGCFACTLGGVNKRTLFLMAAEWSAPASTMSGQHHSRRAFLGARRLHLPACEEAFRCVGCIALTGAVTCLSVPPAGAAYRSNPRSNDRQTIKGLIIFG
jgi:hypothetical protein